MNGVPHVDYHGCGGGNNKAGIVSSLDSASQKNHEVGCAIGELVENAESLSRDCCRQKNEQSYS